MDGGPRVAVVGAGRMGGAMAGTLRRAGLDVVVFNRTRSRAQAVGEATGAAVAATARQAAEGAQVVLSSLADDAAVGAAYTGKDGLVAGLQPGTVVCEASTIDPGTVLRLRPLVEDRGAFLLDTPVSGSVSTVEAGQLTIMAGGDPEVLERARPVLDPLAKQVFHVGGLGSGAVMKLTVNSVLHGLNLALAEGLVLAERAGVARDTAYEVFAASAVAAPFVHYKREAFEHPGQTPVAFSLDLVEKDLDLILALAGETGAAMEQAATNRRVVQAAVAAGLGDHDLSELATYLRSAGQGSP
ncbi:MAG TPA: NAD(P)-dependent oxidoreductase [Actinomycetota bacterium]|jgi:3-hydroxyisobutyrate dehydrogenase-like beta-hydroxyacid dehydrogenase|nr:NAD(P)-dependent oxidoreductase [Actinomycetota bacterium]